MHFSVELFTKNYADIIFNKKVVLNYKRMQNKSIAFATQYCIQYNI